VSEKFELFPGCRLDDLEQLSLLGFGTTFIIRTWILNKNSKTDQNFEFERNSIEFCRI
jgi:hypothetical protein